MVVVVVVVVPTGGAGGGGALTASVVGALDTSCAPSPPPYLAVIVCVPEPTPPGTYSAEHSETAPEASGASVHIPDAPKLAPLVSELKLTLPAGAERVSAATSATVAVQEAVCETTTLGGLQLTEMLVLRRATSNTAGSLDVDGS
ncbi:MAG: hypothetical protein QOI18_1941, partial [Solirubrobacteraceae bacterium]|nr:hypothetical protein [Solirubrobacteraceae bacterium]